MRSDKKVALKAANVVALACISCPWSVTAADGGDHAFVFCSLTGPECFSGAVDVIYVAGTYCCVRLRVYCCKSYFLLFF